jgi:4-hydroxy-tetrahydrodipicolinate synthase
MGHAVAVLKAGAMGLSCIQGNYFPELIVWLCENFNHPEKQNLVAEVQKFYQDNMEVMHDVYPISAKYILQKRGFDIDIHTRRAVGALTEIQTKNLDQLLLDYTHLTENKLF